MNKAIFIDKDGTLIVDVPYNVTPSLIRLYPDVAPALGQLQNNGYQLFVVTNQAGVAHGLFPKSALLAVWQTLSELLAPHAVTFTGFYYCPHNSTANLSLYAIDCECRKPKSGLLLRAAKEHDIDLSQSWMIGDILNDVEAGNRAGCRTILIDRGNETEWQTGAFREPTHTVKDWQEVCTCILGNRNKA